MKNEVKIVDEILEKIVEEAGGDPEKIEELNDMLRELLKDDEYEETPLDKAYELLDKANRTKSKTTGLKNMLNKLMRFLVNVLMLLLL